MSTNKHSLLTTFQDLIKQATDSMSKRELEAKLQKLKDTKVNILCVGVTGAGKSSTINALFNTEVAKVGQGASPETSEITPLELNNVVIWDTPGLGDDKEKDLRYKQQIKAKLAEKDTDGGALIDLVLYVLDGTSRNLGTDYDLLETTIIPALKSDNISEIDRLIIAINKADQAMSGKGWDSETNQPKEKLVQFLEEKVRSTKQRLFDNTGIEFNPIYYAAGFKEDDEAQQPYNMAKLYFIIAEKLKSKKRAVILEDKNSNSSYFSINDNQKDYEKETEKSVFSSIIEFLGNTFSELWTEHKDKFLAAAATLATTAISSLTAMLTKILKDK